MALHDRLGSAVAELLRLLETCEEAIPHKVKAPSNGLPGKGQLSGSLAAWNTPVAMVVLEVHAGVRELEQELRFAISGVHRPRRGGSRANTELALDSLLSLASGADRNLQWQAIRKVESWCWKARIALGQSEPWAQLPREPGEPVARCPWCQRPTLRAKTNAGIVKCCNPGCTDEQGERPVGRVELGALSGASLVWQDRTTGIGSPVAVGNGKVTFDGSAA